LIQRTVIKISVFRKSKKSEGKHLKGRAKKRCVKNSRYIWNWFFYQLLRLVIFLSFLLVLSKQ